MTHATSDETEAHRFDYIVTCHNLITDELIQIRTTQRTVAQATSWTLCNTSVEYAVSDVNW